MKRRTSSQPLLPRSERHALTRGFLTRVVRVLLPPKTVREVVATTIHLVGVESAALPAGTALGLALVDGVDNSTPR